MKRSMMLCFVFFLLIPLVHSATIGMSPASLQFEGRKYTTYTKEITVFNTGSEMMELYFKASKPWIEVPQQVYVSANGRKQITVSVKMPGTTANDIYNADIIISQQKNNFIPSLALPITFKISDQEIINVQ